MESKIIAFILVGIVAGAAVGVGTGYVVWNGEKEEYSFYLYFDDGDDKNGWYSAKASNATDAFKEAMKKAGISWTNSNGYPADVGGVEGLWYICQYLYSSTDSEAAQGSILYPVISYGSLAHSNGWMSIYGYGESEDLKLGQFGSKIFFLSPYAKMGSDTPSPVSVDGWMNSGPFA